MSTHFAPSPWAAACPAAKAPSLCLLLAPQPALDYATLETGRVRLSRRPGGVDKRVEQHVFATSAAARDAQVKDTGIGMPLGPPPWSPPE